MDLYDIFPHLRPCRHPGFQGTFAQALKETRVVRFGLTASSDSNPVLVVAKDDYRTFLSALATRYNSLLAHSRDPHDVDVSSRFSPTQVEASLNQLIAYEQLPAPPAHAVSLRDIFPALTPTFNREIMEETALEGTFDQALQQCQVTSIAFLKKFADETQRGLALTGKHPKETFLDHLITVYLGLLSASDLPTDRALSTRLSPDQIRAGLKDLIVYSQE